VAEVKVNQVLLDFLRDDLGLTGTKEGCGSGDCGACTILLDGQAVNACLVLAVEVDRRDVLTVEGLATGGQLHPLQQAFVGEFALQCGFCTPGILMSATALLAEQPAPTADEVRKAIAGNLCRCTGYVPIVRAILKAGAASGGH
jgi:carbon-monoxide dehydrogenase small subunit